MAIRPIRPRFALALLVVFHVLDVDVAWADQGEFRRKIPGLAALASIGDSISVGFNAEGWGSNFAQSWATGDDPHVQSIALRMSAAYPGVKVEVYNAAVAGARARHLAKQIEWIGNLRLDVVTALIGANDLCAWTDDNPRQLQEFERDIRQGIQTLVDKNPQVKILLSAIPDMYHMYEVGKAKGCTEKWERLRTCRSLLGKNLTALDRQRFIGRWHDMNNVLATIAAGFPDQVEFAADIQNYLFVQSDLSDHDCFHPSLHGQATLASLIWQASQVKVTAP